MASCTAAGHRGPRSMGPLGRRRRPSVPRPSVSSPPAQPRGFQSGHRRTRRKDDGLTRPEPRPQPCGCPGRGTGQGPVHWPGSYFRAVIPTPTPGVQGAGPRASDGPFLFGATPEMDQKRGKYSGISGIWSGPLIVMTPCGSHAGVWILQFSNRNSDTGMSGIVSGMCRNVLEYYRNKCGHQVWDFLSISPY